MKFSIACIAIVGVVAIQSCSKTESNNANSAKPSDAVRQSYAALNNKDTAAYLALLTTNARQRYTYYPKQLAADLAYWSANHFDVQVLDESSDTDAAVVTYYVKVTGKYPEQAMPSMLVTKENGAWKVTATSFYSADRIPQPPQAPGKPGKGC